MLSFDAVGTLSFVRERTRRRTTRTATANLLVV
jgi:hypothetical protein